MSAMGRSALSNRIRAMHVHIPSQLAQLSASILQFGFTNPILIDEAGVLIAAMEVGSQRHRPAKSGDRACGLGVVEMRALWAERFGTAPRFQSVELFRLMLAWRLQAAVHGGLDPAIRKALRRSGPVVAEGQDLGAGATIRRQWQGGGRSCKCAGLSRLLSGRCDAAGHRGHIVVLQSSHHAHKMDRRSGWTSNARQERSRPGRWLRAPRPD